MSQAVHVVCPECGGINRLPAERLGGGGRCGRCKAALFAGRPIEVGAAELDRQLARSDLPLLVDFWAPWCGPCRMMAPAFERAAAELEPGMRLLKLDTEAHPAAAGRFGIRGIPTMILFAGGREVARQSGAMDAGAIVRWARQQQR